MCYRIKATSKAEERRCLMLGCGGTHPTRVNKAVWAGFIERRYLILVYILNRFIAYH